jgi:hypothetical protein
MKSLRKISTIKYQIRIYSFHFLMYLINSSKTSSVNSYIIPSPDYFRQIRMSSSRQWNEYIRKLEAIRRRKKREKASSKVSSLILFHVQYARVKWLYWFVDYNIQSVLLLTFTNGIAWSTQFLFLFSSSLDERKREYNYHRSYFYWRTHIKFSFSVCTRDQIIH